MYCTLLLSLAAIRTIGSNSSKSSIDLIRNKFKRKKGDCVNLVSEFVFLLLPGGYFCINILYGVMRIRIIFSLSVMQFQTFLELSKNL